MDRLQVRRILEQTGEEIRDDSGNVVGYVAAAARFKIDRSYLAGGGFLEVVREEESGDYVGNEWDALRRPGRKGEFYPAGWCAREVWRVAGLEAAVAMVLAYFSEA